MVLTFMQGLKKPPSPLFDDALPVFQTIHGSRSGLQRCKRRRQTALFMLAALFSVLAISSFVMCGFWMAKGPLSSPMRRRLAEDSREKRQKEATAHFEGWCPFAISHPKATAANGPGSSPFSAEATTDIATQFAPPQKRKRKTSSKESDTSGQEKTLTSLGPLDLQLEAYIPEALEAREELFADWLLDPEQELPQDLFSTEESPSSVDDDTSAFTRMILQAAQDLHSEQLPVGDGENEALPAEGMSCDELAFLHVRNAFTAVQQFVF